eukprot:COSAG02_NODE_6346_length_3634_cov_4.485714_2_plen_81_part_00
MYVCISDRVYRYTGTGMRIPRSICIRYTGGIVPFETIKNVWLPMQDQKLHRHRSGTGTIRIQYGMGIGGLDTRIRGLGRK